MLDGLRGLLDRCLLIDNGPGAVAEKKGVAAAAFQGVKLKLEILREDVEGQDRVAVSALLGRRDDRPLGDGVRVDIGEYDLAAGLDGLLVPLRGRNVIGFVPIPGVGGQNLSVQNHVRVYDPLAQNGLHPLEVKIQPGDQLLPGRPVGEAVTDGGSAEGEQCLVDGEVALAFGRIDLRQGGPGFLSILQEGGADQRKAQHRQNDQQAQRDEIEPHAPQNAAQPGSALPPDLGAHCAKTSRTAAVTWS